MAYQDTASDREMIHPGALRKGLIELYSADSAFMEGTMCDAEETMVSIKNEQLFYSSILKKYV